MNSGRKQSCGDLVSRLKTRKLLGVGETNDGDVHRSKLSQILGHSEQLYFRIPKGLRCWQLFSSLLFSTVAISEFLYPGSLLHRPASTPSNNDTRPTAAAHNSFSYSDLLSARLHGAALLTFSLLFWRGFLSSDRELIRVCLLTSLFYCLLHLFIVSLLSFSSWNVWTGRGIILLSLQSIVCVLFAVVTFYFYRSTCK